MLNILVIMGHYGGHFNKILHRCPKLYLPDHCSILALANTFRSFFIHKISVICSSSPSDSHSRVSNNPDTRKVLQNLTCVTANEVRRLVLRAPCMSSDLDSIPTSLVKDCIDLFSNTNNFYNLLNVHWRFLPFTLEVFLRLPHLNKILPSIRIAWTTTGQCLILASFPRFFRK